MSHKKIGTRPVEPTESENGVISTVLEARGYGERGASGLVEVVQTLRDTVLYMKMGSIEMRTEMTWAV